MICFKLSLREVPASQDGRKRSRGDDAEVEETGLLQRTTPACRLGANLHWCTMPSGTVRPTAVPVASWSAPELQRTPNGSQRLTYHGTLFSRPPMINEWFTGSSAAGAVEGALVSLAAPLLWKDDRGSDQVSRGGLLLLCLTFIGFLHRRVLRPAHSSMHACIHACLRTCR